MKKIKHTTVIGTWGLLLLTGWLWSGRGDAMVSEFDQNHLRAGGGCFQCTPYEKDNKAAGKSCLASPGSQAGAVCHLNVPSECPNKCPGTVGQFCIPCDTFVAQNCVDTAVHNLARPGCTGELWGCLQVYRGGLNQPTYECAKATAVAQCGDYAQCQMQ